ncbi:MAG: hypothetical protein JNK29_11030 [Anaerolineales bacterium]|nr:hypothetical protein [Anaerolineales bacterium]
MFRPDEFVNDTAGGPAGLHLEVFREPGADGALRARFSPPQAAAGQPDLGRGGPLFQALECLAAQVAAVRGPVPGAAWSLRSARLDLYRPAWAGEPLLLAGWIQASEEHTGPLTIRVEARRGDGTLCAEGEFEARPPTPERPAEGRPARARRPCLSQRLLV